MLFFHGKQWFSGQDKIALQGAGIAPEGTLGTTLFSLFSRILRVSPCMPLSASIPFSYCQERVIYRVKQLFSAPSFLWFASTLAGELDSRHCTHCSRKHCFRHVPRVPIK